MSACSAVAESPPERLALTLGLAPTPVFHMFEEHD